MKADFRIYSIFKGFSLCIIFFLGCDKIFPFAHFYENGNQGDGHFTHFDANNPDHDIFDGKAETQPVSDFSPSPLEMPDINGGSSWKKWTKLGNAQDPGIYAAQSRLTDFDVYYTSFILLSGAVATGGNRGNSLDELSSGSWKEGDLIIGIGIKWKNGQAGNKSSTFAKFDRNGTGAFSASTSVAPAAGNGKTLEGSYGGTGYTQFNAVNYNFGGQGSVSDWFMRSPLDPTGPLIIPTYEGTKPSANFLNSSRNFWGQTFGGSFEELCRFKRALPFRTYGIANDDGTITSYQWLVNSSVFDRADKIYSAPFQSFKEGWNFSLAVGNTANQFTEIVGLKLPLHTG